MTETTETTTTTIERMGHQQARILSYLAALGPGAQLRGTGDIGISADTIDRCIARGWLAASAGSISLTPAGIHQTRGDGRTSNIPGGVRITAERHVPVGQVGW